jgi:hypothetical protein
VVRPLRTSPHAAGSPRTDPPRRRPMSLPQFLVSTGPSPGVGGSAACADITSISGAGGEG